MKTEPNVSRRDFLRVSATAGVGLVIGVYLSACEGDPTATATKVPAPTIVPDPAETQAEPVPADPTAVPQATDTVEPTAVPIIELQPNAYVKIDSAGNVTFSAPKPDMGQGARTAISMILAEELEVDWVDIRVEQAPADNAYGNQVSGGSQGISTTYSTLRSAGATARGLLVATAAQLWELDPETCRAENGFVIHETSGRQYSYAELVEAGIEVKRQPVQLKEPEDFKVIGRRIGRLDNPQMVDGSAVYGSDINVPGMLYAVIARSPYYLGH